MGLTHQAAHRFGDAQASFSMDREGHGSYYTSLMANRGGPKIIVLVSENPTGEMGLTR